MFALLVRFSLLGAIRETVIMFWSNSSVVIRLIIDQAIWLNVFSELKSLVPTLTCWNCWFHMVIHATYFSRAEWSNFYQMFMVKFFRYQARMKLLFFGLRLLPALFCSRLRFILMLDLSQLFLLLLLLLQLTRIDVIVIFIINFSIFTGNAIITVAKIL